MQPIVSLILFLLLMLPALSQGETVSTVNIPLPEFTLVVPNDDEARRYLGLQKTGGETFSLAEIDADILLIELFSMYCPFCQEEAPAVNMLYQAMEDFATTGISVKIIGLGANNSAFEVDHFRTAYGVPFPLFPDQEMTMYNALDGRGTPGFIGCRRNADGGFTIVLKKSGGFHHPSDFLAELLQKAGYK